MLNKLLAVGIIVLFLVTNGSYSIVCEDLDDKITNDNKKILTKPIFKFGKTLVKEPPILWNITIDEGYYDTGKYIEEREDNGFLIIGELFCNGDADIGIIKINSTGTLEWQKTIDFGNDEQIYGISKTNDGGFICKGYIQNGISDVVFLLGFFIVKFDSFGNEKWNFTNYNLDKNYTNIGASIVLSDGGYLISGSNESRLETYNYWIMKLDNSGSIEWIKDWDKNNGNINYIFETNNSDILIGCGNKLFRTDKLGNVKWQQNYIINYDDSLYIRKIFQNSENKFLIVIQFTYANNHDAWLLNISSTGDMLWKKKIADFYLGSIIQTSDNGYLLSDLNSGKQYFIRYDSHWNITWEKQYNFQTSYWNVRFIENLEEGYTFIVEEYLNGHFINFINVDENGVEKWNKTMPTKGCISSLRTVKQTHDFGYIIYGTKINSNEPDWPWDDTSDIKLIKLSGVILELKDLFGGLSVSFTVENNGTDDFTDIDWRIEYDGNIRDGNNSSGIVEILKAGDKTRLIAETVYGFGWGNVTLRAEDLQYKTSVFFLGRFVIIDRGYKKILEDWFNLLIPK